MIPLVKPYFAPPSELIPEIQKIIYSGYVAEGESVYEFERLFGDYIHNSRVLSLNSGTAALHIALLLAGVKAGDEVISTALTAEPTNVAIALSGAKVVWADVDYNTGLISPKSIRARITERTRAIMVVHYAGMVCDMDEINRISEEFSVPVIEDVAHALGSRYNGDMVGSHSRFAAFSFQAIKHLTTVDGGALTIKRDEDYSRGRLLRWFGLDKTKVRLENDIREAGYKYHMNNVTATIGRIHLRHLADIIERHKSNGRYYDTHLSGISGITTLDYYPNTEPSYWLYTMKVERRDNFIRLMEESGIAASPLHLRNDRHSLFRDSKAHLPILDKFYEEYVHIPCGWWVDDSQRDTIVEVIRRGW